MQEANVQNNRAVLQNDEAQYNIWLTTLRRIISVVAFDLSKAKYT